MIKIVIKNQVSVLQHRDNEMIKNKKAKSNKEQEMLTKCKMRLNIQATKLLVHSIITKFSHFELPDLHSLNAIYLL